MTSAAALWSRLAAAGLALGERPPEPEDAAPWYVRLMLGIAGCIAAGFLIGFVGMGLRAVWESKAGSIGGGLAMIAAAYVLFRAARSDFSSMFGFAVSVAGQGLLAVGLFRIMESEHSSAAWAAMALIEIVLVIAMPNFIHRLASAFAAPVFLGESLEIYGASSVAAGLAAAGVAVLWLNELRAARHHAALAPAAYGLTAALVYVEAELTRHSFPGEALVCGAFLAVVVTLIRRAGCPLRERRVLLTIAAAAAFGAASFKAPGVAAGLMIILLGFANGNRVLTGAGIAALLFYVSKYYYLLEVSLLTKSAVLAAIGAVLLAARWLLLNMVMPEEEAKGA